MESLAGSSQFQAQFLHKILIHIKCLLKEHTHKIYSNYARHEHSLALSSNFQIIIYFWIFLSSLNNTCMFTHFWLHRNTISKKVVCKIKFDQNDGQALSLNKLTHLFQKRSHTISIVFLPSAGAACTVEAREQGGREASSGYITCFIK